MSLCPRDKYENLLRFLGLRECGRCGGSGYIISYGCHLSCEDCRGQGYTESCDWPIEKKFAFPGENK